jgi:hypothetical protein
VLLPIFPRILNVLDSSRGQTPTSHGGLFCGVNTGDNFAFRTAFNRPAPGCKDFLDFEGDGIINTGDNFEFRSRFNRTPSWSV